MSVWVEDKKSYLELACSFHPRCPFCDIPMELYNCKLLHFFLPRGDTKEESNAIDVVLWCTECGYMDIYGVAVEKAHRERIKAKIEESVKTGEIPYVERETGKREKSKSGFFSWPWWRSKIKKNASVGKN